MLRKHANVRHVRHVNLDTHAHANRIALNEILWSTFRLLQVIASLCSALDQFVSAENL